MLNEDDPSLQAADLHNYAQTGTSFLDDTADFFTKGVPLAVGSGLVSMANTAISLGNAVGGDFEKIDYDKSVKEFDDDLSKYYTEHKEGIDLGGFLATSFIPGLGGIKALKLIQGGIMGKNAAAATGLFRNAESRYLEKALSSVQQETNQVFRLLDGNKVASIAAGFGDQALQAAAFETSVLLTMNQNPTINKEDTGYFKTLLYNSPEILSGALIGGGIGGSLNALRISGELKSAIRLRDKEDFPSLNIKELGLSDVDHGTKAAIDFMWLNNRGKWYEQLKQNGEVNDRQIQNFNRSQKQKATELLTRIREDLTEDKDAELSKQVWNHLLRLSANSGTDEGTNLALRLLGAANKIERANEGDAGLTTKVMFNEGYLDERHAKNILQNGKIAPEQISATDAVAQEEAKLQGYDVFKDEAGNYRVVPGTNYERYLKVTKDTKVHDFIVKMAGDGEGEITESAYPVLGDLGKVTFDKGRLLVNKAPVGIKEYDPLVNTPLESSTNFLFQKLAPKFSEDLGTVSIASTDLPRLEKAMMEGFQDNVLVTYPDGGTQVLSPEIMRSLKYNARQELVNAGHDFRRIAREINISQDFAENGTGDFLLGAKEDHTAPLYAKFNYNTNVVPDKFYLRGVSDLNDRMRLAKEHNVKVSALILGDAYNELPKTNGTMLGINTIPQLGDFIKSADESYGSFGELMQQVGKLADREFRARANAGMERLSSAHVAIQGDENLVRNLNIITAKIRSSKEPLIWGDDYGYPDALLPQKTIKDIAKEIDPKSEEFNDRIVALVKGTDAVRIEDPEIADYLKKWHSLESERAMQYNQFFAAKGATTSFDREVLHLPPVNTRKYPYVAFVKETAETEFRPTSVITASDATSLEAKIRAVKQEFGDTLSVYTKDDVANFYKMQGEYESGMLLGNSTVDVSVKKKGILSDFLPRTDKEILDDFTNWHIQQEQSLVRNAVELQYAQEFAELRAMGNTFMEFQKSKFGRELSDKEFAQIRKDNPYEQYISTALATSNYAKYDSVWGRMNSAVEGLGQSMFRVWDSVFNKANKGEIDWVAANTEAEKAGFRPPFKGMLQEIINPLVENKKVVEPAIAKVNAALATTILRLDPLNSLVNILGTPGLIAAELRSISKNITDPAIVGKLADITSTGVPGTTQRIPSMMKLATNALGNFIRDDGTLLKYYESIGAVQGDLQIYKNVLDAAQMSQETLTKGEIGIKQWAGNVTDKAVEFGATISGNNFSEKFTRFMSADIMRQLSEIAQVPKEEMGAYINTFVNRTNGNYVASQRPHIFQGAVGQAIGLFQTFQFMVMQNVVRYVEMNDKVAVAALLGMQNTLFGLQGNPAFYLLNSYIGNTNREHKDMVTGAYATVGQDVGDWLLYGLGANALKTNLYNRGDLTPRYVTVVPTTITDIPAVSIPLKVLGNLFNTFNKITKGAPIPQSVLEGIAQNGASRPLAGLGQLAQGYRATADGNMLVAYNDIDTMLAAAKISGGEELNRAIAIDAYYRQLAYKKKDNQEIAEVGAAFKAKVRSGEPLTNEDMTGFMSNYSRAGGRVDSFNRFMVEQYHNATRSQIDKMKSGLRTSYARNLGTIMGAEDDEFLNQTPSNSSGSGAGMSGESGITQ
jgi:hypothetical protein